MTIGDLMIIAGAMVASGVVMFFAVMVKLERGKNDGYRKEIEELVDMLRDRQVGHVCTPPAFGPRGGNGQTVMLPIGHHWRCSCGVPYVVKGYTPRPDLGPARIEWITAAEQRDGVRPP